MKKLLVIPAIAIGLTSFGLHRGPVPAAINSPVVGVWKNINKAEPIRMVKFFPNGLMNISDSSNNYMTRYQLERNSVDVQGKISWHSTDVPFTAHLDDKVSMELTLNYFGQEKKLYLIKTADLKSGAILLKSR